MIDQRLKTLSNKIHHSQRILACERDPDCLGSPTRTDLCNLWNHGNCEGSILVASTFYYGSKVRPDKLCLDVEEKLFAELNTTGFLLAGERYDIYTQLISKLSHGDRMVIGHQAKVWTNDKESCDFGISSHNG